MKVNHLGDHLNKQSWDSASDVNSLDLDNHDIASDSDSEPSKPPKTNDRFSALATAASAALFTGLANELFEIIGFFTTQLPEACSPGTPDASLYPVQVSRDESEMYAWNLPTFYPQALQATPLNLLRLAQVNRLFRSIFLGQFFSTCEFNGKQVGKFGRHIMGCQPLIPMSPFHTTPFNANIPVDQFKYIQTLTLDYEDLALLDTQCWTVDSTRKGKTIAVYHNVRSAAKRQAPLLSSVSIRVEEQLLGVKKLKLTCELCESVGWPATEKAFVRLHFKKKQDLNFPSRELVRQTWILRLRNLRSLQEVEIIRRKGHRDQRPPASMDELSGWFKHFYPCNIRTYNNFFYETTNVAPQLLYGEADIDGALAAHDNAVKDVIQELIRGRKK